MSGEITLPGDKSISHRALICGAIAKGKTEAKGVLECDDCRYTADAFRDMGIRVSDTNGITAIYGSGLNGLKRPSGNIYVGESGTSMRLLAGILAGQDFEATLTGAESLSGRPMARVTEPLSLMGVDIRAQKGGYPPLVVRGGTVRPIDYRMPVASAQVKSAVLLAALYADGLTTVRESFRSRDHTERMLKHFGAGIKVTGKTVLLKGRRELKPRSFEIPRDISSASFFIAGAVLLGGSKVRIKGVGINPTRAGILDILSRMGASVKIVNRKNSFEPCADIIVRSGRTRGITIERESIPSVIDELPVIFVLAALSKGRTTIKGSGELKVKETDRIHSMIENLTAMGARIRPDGEDVVIEGIDSLRGAALKSFGDHRTCMAMAIAALTARGESAIDDIACVSKSFPGFFRALQSLI